MQISKRSVHYFRHIFNARLVQNQVFAACYYATSVDAMDMFANEISQRSRHRRLNAFDLNILCIRYFMKTDTLNYKNISDMSKEELDNLFQELISKNKDQVIEKLITDCMSIQKTIDENTIIQLYRKYSNKGKLDIVTVLHKYCAKVQPTFYKRNGEFLHYLAKVQCMKGNSEKGLSILCEAYDKYEFLRSTYRLIFRELIQDSVLNRSEASLVIFRKYVLEFSDRWNDHYPLICFWHLCWASSWFSDQMTANELLDSSVALQDILKNKATTFTISVLKDDYNEDAVIHLLQNLLKYQMMTEYAKVLQILFTFKLKNRDIRGCTEIIRNCQVLGVTLPSDQQGRYIKLLIKGDQPVSKPTKPVFRDFKLKF